MDINTLTNSELVSASDTRAAEQPTQVDAQSKPQTKSHTINAVGLKRQYALEDNFRFYKAVKPCKRCGTFVRYKNSACWQCTQERSKNRAKLSGVK